MSWHRTNGGLTSNHSRRTGAQGLRRNNETPPAHTCFELRRGLQMLRSTCSGIIYLEPLRCGGRYGSIVCDEKKERFAKEKRSFRSSHTMKPYLPRSLTVTNNDLESKAGGRKRLTR